jgi:hypothetical protein
MTRRSRRNGRAGASRHRCCAAPSVCWPWAAAPGPTGSAPHIIGLVAELVALPRFGAARGAGERDLLAPVQDRDGPDTHGRSAVRTQWSKWTWFSGERLRLHVPSRQRSSARSIGSMQGKIETPGTVWTARRSPAANVHSAWSVQFDGDLRHVPALIACAFELHRGGLAAAVAARDGRGAVGRIAHHLRPSGRTFRRPAALGPGRMTRACEN